mmetsp:Transcript_114121/g.179660  ORF Transcript_114121/g.179660 Transcript_114121/m.179660 type:complete len:106 (-) Transcript_114121:104-421(-)
MNMVSISMAVIFAFFATPVSGEVASRVYKFTELPQCTNCKGCSDTAGTLEQTKTEDAGTKTTADQAEATGTTAPSKKTSKKRKAKAVVDDADPPVVDDADQPAGL